MKYSFFYKFKKKYCKFLKKLDLNNLQIQVINNACTYLFFRELVSDELPILSTASVVLFSSLNQKNLS